MFLSPFFFLKIVWNGRDTVLCIPNRSVILFWARFMDTFKNLMKAMDFFSVYAHTWSILPTISLVFCIVFLVCFFFPFIPPPPPRKQTEAWSLILCMACEICLTMFIVLYWIKLFSLDIKKQVTHLKRKVWILKLEWHLHLLMGNYVKISLWHWSTVEQEFWLAQRF